MKHIIIIAALSAPFFASAGIYMEPYLGGGLAYSRMRVENKSSRNLLFTGLVVGGRLGGEWMRFKAGVDVFYNRYHTNNSFSMPSVVVHNPHTSVGFSQAGDSVSIQYSSTESNFNPLSVGLFGILDIPIVMDVYGSAFYSFGTKESLAYHGPGVKAGISYLPAIFVQLNLEAQWTHYFCRSAECLTSKGFNLFSTMLLLSIPISSNVLSFAWWGGDSSNMASSYESESTTEMNSDASIQSSDVTESGSTKRPDVIEATRNLSGEEL